MLKLFPFQIESSRTIAERFNNYSKDPLYKTRTTIIPFYQVLSAITGSGKTAILANTLEEIRAMLGVAPIVLWVSRGRVVVDQTLSGLSTGRYAPLVASYDVKPLLDVKQEDIERTDRGLLLVATVGKFNQKDKEKGGRKIFQVALDAADESLWERLRKRQDAGGFKRQLIVVYDEGHNLSEQQAKIMEDLNPDALISATATDKAAPEIHNNITRIRQDLKWAPDDFKTTVKSSDVVAAGLIKENLRVGGFTTPREQAIDQMLEDMKVVEDLAMDENANFRPKAIYVTHTNVAQSSKFREIDDPKKPFSERKAAPILIWRYLVEEKGVHPDEIAVYLTLSFDKKFPAPDNFHLFSKGEEDYYRFTEGNYRHIIFNQSLQEGWDDPECGFCYVDKDMGSTIQVAQITGRVLRQPGAKHYSDPRLNTANFYIRTDEKKTFEAVLGEIQAKIARETPEINVIVANPKSGSGQKVMLRPKKNRTRTIPVTNIDSSEAKRRIDEVLEDMMDHSAGGPNTIGAGSYIQVLQRVGSGEESREEWVDVQHSNAVTARWILRRELELKESRAITLFTMDNPKFDARIEYTSRAANEIRDSAKKIAELYLDWSEVKIKGNDNPYPVPPIAVDPDKMEKYKHAIHEGYSGLNELEKTFASAIDRTRRVWTRNPVRGYGIKMLDGKSEHFYPDFLVWVDNDVYAIDPKADNLIKEDAHRKLLNLKQDGRGTNIYIRLITDGEWDASGNKKKGSNNGYTVWKLKDGKPAPYHCKDEDDAIKTCLMPD